jgi:hypothetical protein
VSVPRRWIAIASLTLACGPSVAVDEPTTTTATASDDDDDDGGSPGPSSATEPNPSTTTSMSETTGDADTTTSSTTGADEASNPFIPRIDQPWDESCDVWIDDCPVGEKCMPYASDNSFSHTRCIPIAENANEVGDSCTVEGSGIAGIDDCVKHSMCWDVDPETNIGTCMAMCDGSLETPTCSEVCTACDVMFDGLVNLCLPFCNPLVQDCDRGETCRDDDDSFHCVPQTPAEVGVGEPCEFIDGCPAGLTCVSASLVPGCGPDGQCCTPFCDASTDTTCDDLIAGSTCVPWDSIPPCFATAIGSCRFPQ